MLRSGWRAGVLRGAAVGCVAALTFCPLAGCHRTTAQDSAGGCTPPGPWLEAGARPGRPAMEFAACLMDQAYETRNLSVPVDATANGIIAQCHVRVDRFEGAASAGETGSLQERQAADQAALREATAAISQYRQCVGR